MEMLRRLPLEPRRAVYRGRGGDTRPACWGLAGRFVHGDSRKRETGLEQCRLPDKRGLLPDCLNLSYKWQKIIDNQ
jgi:hypothetical protein